MNLITDDIKNTILKYIKYDDKIEFNCEDCNQLLLINDIRKCRGKTLNEWDRVPKICNKK